MYFFILTEWSVMDRHSIRILSHTFTSHCIQIVWIVSILIAQSVHCFFGCRRTQPTEQRECLSVHSHYGLMGHIGGRATQSENHYIIKIGRQHKHKRDWMDKTVSIEISFNILASSNLLSTHSHPPLTIKQTVTTRVFRGRRYVGSWEGANRRL